MFVAAVATDKLDDAPDSEPDRLARYKRQVTFASFPSLLARLEDAMKVFPALIPRLTPVRGAVAARVGQEGPAYMYYTGCTIACTPVSRTTDDMDSVNRKVTSLSELWAIDSVDIFRVNIAPVDVDPFDDRGERALQLVENSLIRARYPNNLNSAPGGFSHDFRLDVYPPSPLPNTPNDAVPTSTVEGIKRHLEGLYQAYSSRRSGGTSINLAALAHQIDAATPRQLVGGRPLLVAIGKDVTHEEFNGAQPEIDTASDLPDPDRRP